MECEEGTFLSGRLASVQPRQGRQVLSEALLPRALKAHPSACSSADMGTASLKLAFLSSTLDGNPPGARLCFPLLEQRRTDRAKEPSAAKHSDLINRPEISGAIRGEKKTHYPLNSQCRADKLEGL